MNVRINTIRSWFDKETDIYKFLKTKSKMDVVSLSGIYAQYFQGMYGLSDNSRDKLVITLDKLLQEVTPSKLFFYVDEIYEHLDFANIQEVKLPEVS